MIIKTLTALHLTRSPLLYKTISLSLILEAEGLGCNTPASGGFKKPRLGGQAILPPPFAATTVAPASRNPVPSGGIVLVAT